MIANLKNDIENHLQISNWTKGGQIGSTLKQMPQDLINKIHCKQMQ
jgi:hypothetical protein